MEKMKERGKIIFDMDGTLYNFDNKRGTNFTSSRFYADVKENAYRYISETLCIDIEQAILIYQELKNDYRGEVSLGIEDRYGVNRYKYFENTWNLNPAEYIEKNDEIQRGIKDLQGRIALLTAAPRIWAIRVLAFLDMEKLFGQYIYTGEPDLRKPNPDIFEKIAIEMGVEPSMVASVGDQEESDILPAKIVGMKTVLISEQPSRQADFTVKDVVGAIQILKSVNFI